jgi:Amt family ammonium transporter
MNTTFLMNSLWTMVGAVLVILMIGGFILLETGSTRMKNAGHIAGKTILTFSIGSLIFWAVGFALAFGKGSPIIGLEHFLYSGYEIKGLSLSGSVYFLFQLAFACISLTIAFGGFAERAKLSAYLIFSVLFSVFVYPPIAHWIWGSDGWLAALGQQDFAGSTVVHLTGAMAALAATILLKPRIGKFNKDGSANTIEGHSQVFTTLSVLILWVGWFGFNAGSTLGVDKGFFGYVGLNTNLGAAAGTVAAMIVSWIVLGKADVPVMLNGALAGLVAITASCGFVAPWAAVVIGFIAGILVFYSMRFFEKRKIDDPIAALSVHGTAGVWGTLSNGFFATKDLAAVGKPGLFYGGGFHQLFVQAIGVIACGLFAFIVSFILLYIMKAAMKGLRVSEEEEIIGLDMSEHGSYGYPELLKRKDNLHLNEALKAKTEA